MHAKTLIQSGTASVVVGIGLVVTGSLLHLTTIGLSALVFIIGGITAAVVGVTKV